MLDWLFLFMQIMLINIVLSGDNAVVIGMASKGLPPHQRKQAIWWGAFGAIGLRLILTVVAIYLLKVPYIQAAGALLLVYIAIKLLAEDEKPSDVREASSFGKAIWTIIVADFVMSLDNVLAIAAAAKGDMAVIILGVGLSVPIIIWGSSAVSRLLHKIPLLVYAGSAILGFTAGEMVLNDQKLVDRVLMRYDDTIHWLIPTTAAAFVLVIGHLLKLRNTTRV